MKVYVLIRDETDYNGDRYIFGVYTNYDAAKDIGDWEIEKTRDWLDSMRKEGDMVGNWVPTFHIEETEFHQ